MIKKIEIRTTFVFVLLVLCSAMAWGQANTSLRGTVADQSAAVVPKAQLTLTNTATALERKTVSRDTGEYEFLQVPPGPYRLTAEAPGFKKYEAKWMLRSEQ